MWLHEPTGALYIACSDSQSRTQWLPAFANSPFEGVRRLTIAESASSMPPDAA
jgi:hypothetical protein